VALTWGLAVGRGGTVRDGAPQAVSVIEARHAAGSQAPRRPLRGRRRSRPRAAAAMSSLTSPRIGGARSRLFGGDLRATYPVAGEVTIWGGSVTRLRVPVYQVKEGTRWWCACR
jgi:hypothetical protein